MCVNFWETARICTNSVISRQLNTEVALLEWDVAGKDAMCMCPAGLQHAATICHPLPYMDMPRCASCAGTSWLPAISS